MSKNLGFVFPQQELEAPIHCSGPRKIETIAQSESAFVYPYLFIATSVWEGIEILIEGTVSGPVFVLSSIKTTFVNNSSTALDDVRLLHVFWVHPT